MSATTIVEFFIEDQRIYVELEIGLADVEAFRNLLPDDIYERLGNPRLPLSERLPRFFREDLVIAGDTGEPLEGRLLGIAPQPRLRRDEITGEALPRNEEEDELVIFARLEYALERVPATLTFMGPRGERQPSIGFVVYHRGIPVNDFRYLGPSQTLELDSDDPWYTRFRNRNLRRTYFAPMSGFIYIEPYEVRKEIIVRPLDLQRWVDLGLEGRKTIPVEIQAELKRQAAEFLRTRQKVLIDGRAIEPELARVHFLERTLRTSRVIDPPEELDIHSAILGVIFVYPTDGLPQKATLDWDLWHERIDAVPAASVDQAGPLPVLLERDFPMLEWNNFLQNPRLPMLKVLAPPPSALARVLLWVRWVLLLFTAGAVAWALGAPQQRGVAVAVLALLTVTAFGLARGAALTQERAREVVASLLHNVYHAFDFRGEEQIYDTLARSVEGDLLERIYLETRRGLELANQGGARAKVKEIELVGLNAQPADDGRFVAAAVWNVAGSIGHWGHVHQRKNRYRAELTVAPIDDVWKLVDLEILDEERL